MQHEKTRQMILGAMFTAITAVAAQLVIPLGFTPMPFTCAMIAIYLTGALLKPKTAFFAQLAYLLIGAAGAPVFSYFSGGLHKLVGPTGGYLFVYPLMALTVSWLAEHWGRGFIKYSVSMFAALILCYAAGTGWFMLTAHMNLWGALTACVLPFIPMDLAKIVLSAALSCAVFRALGKARLLVTVQ